MGFVIIWKCAPDQFKSVHFYEMSCDEMSPDPHLLLIYYIFELYTLQRLAPPCEWLGGDIFKWLTIRHQQKTCHGFVFQNNYDNILILWRPCIHIHIHLYGQAKANSSNCLFASKYLLLSALAGQNRHRLIQYVDLYKSYTQHDKWDMGGIQCFILYLLKSTMLVRTEISIFVTKKHILLLFLHPNL